MSIDAASAVRAAAEHRDASRHFAQMREAERAESRRDQRIVESKEAAGARPRPSDQAPETPPPRPRADPAGLVLDVLA